MIITTIMIVCDNGYCCYHYGNAIDDNSNENEYNGNNKKIIGTCKISITVMNSITIIVVISLADTDIVAIC